MIKTHHRACHLCEAICGLEIKTEGDQIVSIKGDKADPLSRGFLCPKAAALQDIHTDPDRLRAPMMKIEGAWQEVSWRVAIAHAAEKLSAIQRAYGDDAVGLYAGNPSIHSVGTWMYSSLLTRALNTRNRFSATSVDQLPHHMVGLLTYGHWLRVPVPDIDHSQWVMMLGANPLASNGSVMTAPDMPGKLKKLKDRGGKLVVVDPRRTETAKVSDHYVAMPPGQDIYFLLALLQHIFAQGWINAGRFADRMTGLDDVARAVADFTPALAEQQTGISAAIIEQLAFELVNEPKAAVYGRMGVSTQRHGTLCQWAIQLLNILTGHLDVRGGLMLSNPAIDPAGAGSNPQCFGRAHSRVRGLPDFAGEFPAATMAEEILTPGVGQIKAMVIIAGNPVLSTPNGVQLDRAFEQLEFTLAIDLYLNETTRHADLILPPVSPLEREHYDSVFLALAVHNTARYNLAIFEKDENGKHDWEIFAALGNALRELKNMPAKEVVAPAQLIEHLLNAGPHKLTMAALLAQPSGVDLGCHTDRMAALYSAEQPLQLAPLEFLAALQALPLNPAPPLASAKQELLLIGRRHVRSNNSWMHNYRRLVKGKARDQLMMHPTDMAARGISEGDQVLIASRINRLTTTVQACPDILPGVVSLPHGYGHHRTGTRTHIAQTQAGISINDLTDELALDGISGNAAVNGVPVSVCVVVSSTSQCEAAAIA